MQSLFLNPKALFFFGMSSAARLPSSCSATSRLPLLWLVQGEEQEDGATPIVVEATRKRAFSDVGTPATHPLEPRLKRSRKAKQRAAKAKRQKAQQQDDLDGGYALIMARSGAAPRCLPDAMSTIVSPPVAYGSSSTTVAVRLHQAAD